MRVIRQFPHCDQKVLHAPGECQYCDERPEWQELREAWALLFLEMNLEQTNYSVHQLYFDQKK